MENLRNEKPIQGKSHNNSARAINKYANDKHRHSTYRGSKVYWHITV